MRYRSPLYKALGLRQGQRVEIIDFGEWVCIKGVNPSAEMLVRRSLRFDPEGRWTIDRESLVWRSGAQFVFRNATPEEVSKFEASFEG